MLYLTSKFEPRSSFSKVPQGCQRHCTVESSRRQCATDFDRYYSGPTHLGTQCGQDCVADLLMPTADMRTTTDDGIRCKLDIIFENRTRHTAGKECIFPHKWNLITPALHGMCAKMPVPASSKQNHNDESSLPVAVLGTTCHSQACGDALQEPNEYLYLSQCIGMRHQNQSRLPRSIWTHPYTSRHALPRYGSVSQDTSRCP